MSSMRDGAYLKIDFHLTDSIGRTGSGTIQLDFQMPENLTTYRRGRPKHRPAVIHRVSYGAIERFMALHH